MGDAMRAAGVGPEVEFEGRFYNFQPVRVHEIGKFEAWLERQAWEMVLRAETWMPPVKVAELREETRHDIAGKAYSYGSRAFRTAQVSSPGIKQIALISLRAGEGNAPEIDGELIDRLFTEKPEEMAAVMVGISWLKPPLKPPPKPAGEVGDVQ